MNAIAVLTGASGGIGGAILTRLVDEGYVVIACGRNAKKLPTHSAIHPFQCDLTTISRSILEGALAIMTAHVGTSIQLLVCAHGAAPVVTATLELMEEDFTRIWKTDVWGSLLMAQAVAPYMMQRGTGSITFVTSLHAKQTYPARCGYASAKSGLGGLARSLALEWGPYGIRSNCVLPWQCHGPRTDALISQAKDAGEDLLEAYRQRSPVRELVTRKEVADAVMFLAKNLSMNGTELVIDGGVSASMWYRGFTDTPVLEGTH